MAPKRNRRTLLSSSEEDLSDFTEEDQKKYYATNDRCNKRKTKIDARATTTIVNKIIGRRKSTLVSKAKHLTTNAQSVSIVNPGMITRRRQTIAHQLIQQRRERIATERIPESSSICTPIENISLSQLKLTDNDDENTNVSQRHDKNTISKETRLVRDLRVNLTRFEDILAAAPSLIEEVNQLQASSQYEYHQHLKDSTVDMASTTENQEYF